MSLLQALNLPVPKHFLPTGGRPLAPPTNSAPRAMPPPPTQAVAKPPPQAVAKPPGGDATDPRAEALKLRGAIESRRAQALELLMRLQKVLPLLTSKVANTAGDEKKKLLDQHALLVRSIDDAKSRLSRAEADLRVIENPGSKGEELVAVIDRQRKAPKAGDITVPALEAPPGQAGGSKELTSGKEGNVLKDKVDGKKSGEVKGVKVSLVGELHANVTCEVGIATGDPKLYPVTLTVKFGGSAGISAKKGSNGAEVKASVTEEMKLTRQLSETELADYTRKLQVASKGAPVADSRPEFGIITLGAIQENWYGAYELYKSGKGKAAHSINRSGDSIEVSREGSRTVGGGVGGGPVELSGEDTRTKRNSTEIKVNDKGRKEAEGKQEYGEEQKRSGKVKMSGIGVGVGGKRVHRTRVGYLFEIDPKDDPHGQILKELMECETDEQYVYFMAKYPKEVKRIGTTIGQTDEQDNQVGVEALGKSLEIGTGKGVTRDVRLDAKNRVVSKETRAHNKSGGDLGGYLSDSEKEEAVAKTGADGKSTFQGKRTSEQNYGKKSGTRQTIFNLSDAACAKIGWSVYRTRTTNWWDTQCRVPDAKKDWGQAFIAIRGGKYTAGAVSHALAEFVGQDIDRLKIVEALFRGLADYIEFPASLLRLRESYEAIVDEKLPDRVEELAKTKGKAAAADYCKGMLTVADTLQPQIAACDDFENGNLKMKMLDRLRFGRTRLHKAVLAYSGTKKPEEDANVLAQEGIKLYELCVRFSAEEAKLVDQLDDKSKERSDERLEGRNLRVRLEDLHKRWFDTYRAMTENFQKRKATAPVPPMGTRLSPRPELIKKYTEKFPPLSS